MQRDETHRPVGAPPGRKTRTTAAQIAKKSIQPRVVLPLEHRDALTEGKRQLAKAITEYGIADIVKIIKAGPYQPVEVEREGEAVVIPMHEERSKLWQYAMNYAADRGGLPRIHEMDLVAGEGIAPIEVRFGNFEKPADT